MLYLECLPDDALGLLHGDALGVLLQLIQHCQLTELEHQVQLPFPPATDTRLYSLLATGLKQNFFSNLKREF